jgi:uncharacterized protein YdeI (YjbR/CyaY-like superfamily)
MPTPDPRIDEYLANAPEYARPILTHLREVVHAGCPDVVETMKWSRPAFEYHGVLCGMAAFKSYVMFGFWKASLIVDQKTGKPLDFGGEGSFGKITKLSDLPARKTLIAYIKEACRLNEEGIKAAPARKSTTPRPALPVPPYLSAALKKNKKASAAFEKFSPSHRREYIEWLMEAKTDATRETRLATALEWMAEGKPRNWKYMPKV